MAAAALVEIAKKGSNSRAPRDEIAEQEIELRHRVAKVRVQMARKAAETRRKRRMRER